MLFGQTRRPSSSARGSLFDQRITLGFSKTQLHSSWPSISPRHPIARCSPDWPSASLTRTPRMAFASSELRLVANASWSPCCCARCSNASDCMISPSRTRWRAHQRPKLEIHRNSLFVVLRNKELPRVLGTHFRTKQKVEGHESSLTLFHCRVCT